MPFVMDYDPVCPCSMGATSFAGCTVCNSKPLCEYCGKDCAAINTCGNACDHHPECTAEEIHRI